MKKSGTDLLHRYFTAIIVLMRKEKRFSPFILREVVINAHLPVAFLIFSIFLFSNIAAADDLKLRNAFNDPPDTRYFELEVIDRSDDGSMIETVVNKADIKVWKANWNECFGFAKDSRAERLIANSTLFLKNAGPGGGDLLIAGFSNIWCTRYLLGVGVGAEIGGPGDTSPGGYSGASFTPAVAISFNIFF